MKGQTQTFNVGFSNQSIESILPQITLLTGYSFAYGQNINLECKVNIPETKYELILLLNKLFNNCQISWELVGNTIVLSPKKFHHKNYVIKGVIKDTKGNSLPFVNVFTANNHATISDENGHFILKNVTTDKKMLYCSFIGYKTDTIPLTFSKDSILQLTIVLKYSDIQLQEAIIEADKIVKPTNVSSLTLTNSELQTDLNITNDPIKSINQYPAIATKGDLNNSQEVSIRGGDPSENLIMLDNVAFLFPFYGAQNSVFNPDVIEKASILTGGYQSTYGGAMSGIINLTTRNGSLRKTKGSLGVNIFKSTGLIEGPIKKDTASYIVAVRKSNISVLVDKNIYPHLINLDAFGKIYWKFHKNHQLSFSTLNIIDDFFFNGQYSGTDSVQHPFSFKDRMGSYTLQLQSIVSSKLYNKLSTNFTFQNVFANESLPNYPNHFDFKSRIISFRNDLTWFTNNKTTLKTGIEVSYSSFIGNEAQTYSFNDHAISDTSLLYHSIVHHDFSKNIAFYGNIKHQIFQKLSYNAGLRFNYLFEFNIPTIAPRLSLNYTLVTQWEMKFATGIFYQAPTISELKHNSNLNPNQSIHYIAGIYYKPSNRYQMGVEAYYKDYKNLIIFDTLYNFSNAGYGFSKGFEIYNQFKWKNTTTRIGYGFLIANRKRNLQETSYPFYFEQRHRLNLSLNFTPKNRVSNWLPSSYTAQLKLFTGTPFTPVTGRNASGNLTFGEINSSHNPNYNNLNLKLNWEFKMGKKKLNTLIFFLEFWNLYNRKNFKQRRYIFSASSPNNIDPKTEFVDPILPNFGLKINFN